MQGFFAPPADRTCDRTPTCRTASMATSPTAGDAAPDRDRAPIGTHAGARSDGGRVNSAASPPCGNAVTRPAARKSEKLENLDCCEIFGRTRGRVFGPGASDLMNVRFGPLCRLKSDISRGPRCARTRREQMQQIATTRSPRRSGRVAWRERQFRSSLQPWR